MFDKFYFRHMELFFFLSFIYVYHYYSSLLLSISIDQQINEINKPNLIKFRILLFNHLMDTFP